MKFAPGERRYLRALKRPAAALASLSIILPLIALPPIRLPIGSVAANAFINSEVSAFPADGTGGVSTPSAGPVPGDVEVGASPVADRRLNYAIEQLIGPEQGVYGIVLMRPDGKLLYSRNGDTPFVSASLYKLVLLADICAAIDAGTLTLDSPLYVAPEYFDDGNGPDSYFDDSYAGYDTTVQEAIFATGAYSSNVAAHALLSVTSAEELNWTAEQLGLTGTFLFADPTSIPNWPPHPTADTTPADALNAEQLVLSYASDGHVNLTTPMDMARYFYLLMNGEIYNERVSEMILEILQQQMIDDRFPALLPPGTQFAHKTGNLDRVVHDVGVIYAPDGPIILAAMIEASANDDRATQVVQRLALIAYGVYDVPPVIDQVPAVEGSPVTPDGTEPQETGEAEEDWPVDAAPDEQPTEEPAWDETGGDEEPTG